MGEKLPGSAPSDHYKFFLGNGTPLEKQDAIFPIVKKDDNGNYQLVGTGFFICREGVFVTATHVLKDVFDRDGRQTHPIGIFHFTHENGKSGYILRPILWAWHSDHADVSIGIVASATHNITGAPLLSKTMTLSREDPKVGCSVVTYAWPNFQNEPDGVVQKLYFQADFYDGKIEEYYPNGRDRVLMSWPCYRTSIHLHGGSSGGPVIDDKGKVCGVNCRSFEPDTDLSFITPIQFIFNGYVEKVRFKEEPTRRISIEELIEKGFISCTNQDSV